MTDVTFEQLAPPPALELDEFGPALVSWGGQPRGLYPRYKGKNARGITVSFRLPDGLEREADRLIQVARERGLPWESRTDFFRDAVAWFATVVRERVDARDPILSTLQHERELQDQVDFYGSVKVRAEKFVKEITLRLVDLVLEGEADQARAELLLARQRIATMSDAYTRRKYQSAMTNNPRFVQAVQALEEPEAVNGEID